MSDWERGTREGSLFRMRGFDTPRLFGQELVSCASRSRSPGMERLTASFCIRFSRLHCRQGSCWAGKPLLPCCYGLHPMAYGLVTRIHLILTKHKRRLHAGLRACWRLFNIRSFLSGLYFFILVACSFPMSKL